MWNKIYEENDYQKKNDFLDNFHIFHIISYSK